MTKVSQDKFLEYMFRIFLIVWVCIHIGMCLVGLELTVRKDV
jgi:hypothetical protein